MKYKPPDHKQFRVRYPFTREIIQVDEGIVEILELLWGQGVETFYSCEGDEMNYAYIAFRPSGYQAVSRVIHSMSLPYVRWVRNDPYGHLRERGPMWSVYWVWDWSIYVRIQALLNEDWERSRYEDEG